MDQSYQDISKLYASELQIEELDVKEKGAGSKDIDGLSLYMREISRYKLLTPDEERSLFQIYYEGKKAKDKIEKLQKAGKELPKEVEKELQKNIVKGKNAKDKIVCCNLRWVVSIAKNHLKPGAQLLDIIQDGNMGLIRAVEKFDLDRGVRFSTYAFWPIRLAIKHGTGIQTSSVIYPIQVIEKKIQIDFVTERLTSIFHRTPTDAEVASELNLSLSTITTMRRITQKPVSLSAPIQSRDSNYDVSSCIYENLIEDKDCMNEVYEDALRQSLFDSFDILTDKEKLVISYRFGLKDGARKTLAEIGKMLGGITRERVRQIEKKALSKLKGSDDVLYRLDGWLDE